MKCLDDKNSPSVLTQSMVLANRQLEEMNTVTIEGKAVGLCRDI